METLADLGDREKDAYVDGLARVIAAGPELSGGQLRVFYRVCAVAEVEQQARQDLVHSLASRRPRRKVTLPRFRDPLVRYSFAKDALIIAKGGDPESGPRRRDPVMKWLGLTKEIADVLQQWTQWEERILAAITKGDLVVRAGYSPYRIFRLAETAGMRLRAFYLSGTRLALAAVGIPRGGAAAHPNRLLVALGASLGGAWSVVDFLEGGTTSPPGELLTESLRDTHSAVAAAMQHVRKIRDRYLKAVEDDLKTFNATATLPMGQQISRKLLSESLQSLWSADRILVPVSTQAVRRKKVREPAAIDTILEFANKNLGKISAEDTRLWTRRLLNLSPYSQDRQHFGCSLEQIQKEVREILRDLSTGHPWSSSQEYARLANNRQLDCVDGGLNLFALGSTGATILPISLAIAWEHDEGERFIPWDPRSCLIMILRAEIRKINAPCIMKCPVCRMFFVRAGRRLYCSDRCRMVGNELLRDREKRNEQKRLRYWEHPSRRQRSAEMGTTRPAAI